KAGRIHLFGARCEEDVDAFAFGDLGVARLIARVRSEIGAGVELRRVDEERRDDDVVLGPRGAKEGAMAGMERTHGRDEAHLAVEREVTDRAHDLHVASASVAPARVSYR